MTKETGLNVLSHRLSRPHAHTLSAGSNPGRISRRKSGSSQVHSTALAAAISIHLDKKNTTKEYSKQAPITGSLPLPLQQNFDGLMKIEENNLGPLVEDEDACPRGRRASESQTDNGKKNKLKCDSCGKVYTHSSCLTKHLWEHTPEWGLTSTLQISKHQQVQLLEAAYALVNMKSPSQDSEGSSSDISASSDHHESSSSPETTPPLDDSHQFSTTSSAFSHSYNSDRFRPTTSGTDIADLSISFDYQIMQTLPFDQYDQPREYTYTPSHSKEHFGCSLRKGGQVLNLDCAERVMLSDEDEDEVDDEHEGEYDDYDDDDDDNAKAEINNDMDRDEEVSQSSRESRKLQGEQQGIFQMD